MLLPWLLSTALAAEPACTYVKLDDIVDRPAPAVVVLGERHGSRKDLGRALAVARRLKARGKVTVALEAVHRSHQGVLDAFAAGKVDADALEAELDWDRSWGFAYRAYEPLVTASEEDMKVVGVGVDLGPKPDDVQIPLPPRYVDLLRPAMGGHEVPLDQEQHFVEAMAWRDHALAKAALDAWDGEGFLVLVVGRGHVEGGKGTVWQAQRLTEAPVEGFVLAPGVDPPCHPGDRLWR